MSWRSTSAEYCTGTYDTGIAAHRLRVGDKEYKALRGWVTFLGYYARIGLITRDLVTSARPTAAACHQNSKVLVNLWLYGIAVRFTDITVLLAQCARSTLCAMLIGYS